MKIEEINQWLKDHINKGITMEIENGYRCYTDGKRKVPITTRDETLDNIFKVFIQPSLVTTDFVSLPRCSIYVGQPDTGKTYEAQALAETLKVPYILIMARDNLNLETLLEDFTLVDGKPVFTESLALKLLSGTENGIIIIDEFNTLLTGVMKTLQPLLDTTSKTFEYKGKIYKKNLNCKFILTLNDKDKGISILPDAILSRSYIKYFEPCTIDTLVSRTNTDREYVTNLQTLYQTLGLLSLFGTRQINLLKNKTVDEITSHLHGLLTLRNMKDELINSMEVQRLIQLCSK